MIRVTVSGLAVDSRSNSPVVLLKEIDGERVLPIWIGTAEASAIAFELRGVNLKRPLTHDLFKSVLDALGVKLAKVVVSDLIEQTFYAEFFLQMGEKVFKIDARPSDSIVMALKHKAPIFVAEKVMGAEAQAGDEDREKKAQQLRERLQRIKPEDFGKFTL
ncbi:MAG TPA: bifunctional nuclease family protein [Candidatus Latescibacteria bacterium]|nr:bifunctional nuclease family protein [Candidatus Latescibacterota bacterium]